MKEEIAKNSVKLFEQKGFTETSIQDIVDSLGVTKGTFYYYYTSKENLLMEIHLHYIDDLLKKQKTILESVKSFRGKLVEIVKLIIHDIELHGAHGRVYFREIRNLTPEHNKTIKGKREEFRVNVMQVITKGIQSGEFRKNLHPKMISFAVLGVTNWSYHWFQPCGKLTVKELADMYVDFILNGIIAERDERDEYSTN
ncbi:TetR/AcrR family transcriptional regulator [Lysinibacillus sp. LZ02]|uniref:TetR/AcrR family transcriptional regulator n=1 Tax=Lysinibacillus sp. LZ02 TaxID=3420668 RepID=UPI003D36BD44